MQAADVYSDVFELLPRAIERVWRLCNLFMLATSLTNMGRVLLKDYVGTICHALPDNFMHLG